MLGLESPLNFEDKWTEVLRKWSTEEVHAEVSEVQAWSPVFPQGVGCPSKVRLVSGPWQLMHPPFSEEPLHLPVCARVLWWTVSFTSAPLTQHSGWSGEEPSCWTGRDSEKGCCVLGGISSPLAPQVPPQSLTCFCGGMWWVRITLPFREHLLDGCVRCFHDYCIWFKNPWGGSHT